MTRDDTPRRAASRKDPNTERADVRDPDRAHADVRDPDRDASAAQGSNARQAPEVTLPVTRPLAPAARSVTRTRSATPRSRASSPAFSGTTWTADERRAHDTALARPNARGDEFDRRYAELGMLGRGGMGEVRLFQDRVIGREVAVKWIRGSSGTGADAYRRFVREARVQGQLEHPAIVPVHDLASLPDGSPYFTMKCVRGDSLRDVLDAVRAGDSGRDYSLRKLLAAFSRAALAVDFAHRHGVVHRDLKPGNVMLGDFGEVYVLDWGLAKLLQGDRGDGPGEDGGDGVAESARPAAHAPAETAPVRDGSRGADSRRTIRDEDDGEVTVAGEVMGTPGYMAPEQVRGLVSELDARADVYALGAILFELLTLERLHTGETTASLLGSTVNGVDARPSVRAPDRDIPPELDELCVRATALEPSERLASARALSDAIEGYLDGDRDLALRRRMAAERAAEARAAFARSLECSRDPAGAAKEEAERGDAMRAVTAALGLDPDCADARATLVRLLAEPPRALPAGAEAEVARWEREQSRGAARMALAVYLGFALYIPFPLWMGLRSVTAFAVLGGSIAVCALLSALYVRRPPADAGAPLPHLLFATLAVIASTTMLGPFMLIPLLAFANTVGYIAGTGRKRRWVVVAAGCAAVLIPPALHWLGALPASVEIQSGAITVFPVMFEFPPLATSVFLLVTSTAIVITGAVFASRLRDGFTAAQRRLQVQAWQLRQLVPADAADAAADRAPRGPGAPGDGSDDSRATRDRSRQ